MAGRRLLCAAMRYGGCGLKPWLIKLLKFGISAALIAWLVVDAGKNATFATLVDQPKHWGLLATAFAFCFTSIVLTILRWYYLVRALGIPFTLLDAFRLGFVGYMFNFVSLGNVGGDLFKAIFLAREHKERRAEAVASVMADRIIGLYALFLLATAVMFGFGRFNAANEEMNVICRATLVGTLVGTFGLALLLWPHFTEGKFAAALRRLPRVGPTADKLLGAVRIYRGKPGVLVGSLVMSLAVHTIATIGFYLIARGLPGTSPGLADHFIIVPLSMVAGALPLPLNGLGAFENVVDFLYRSVPQSVVVLTGQGLIVSIGYRAITILIAMVGVGFYLGQRREGATLSKAAETSPSDENKTEGQLTAA
jgi:glycosyltransferase 2 family protein